MRPPRTGRAPAFLAFFAWLALFASATCSAPPAHESTLPGVANFAQVTATLWRGAQPTAEGFRNLEAAGVKTVVNLRSDHDDAPLLEGTRLEPIRIPTRPWSVDEDDVVAFLKVAQDPARGPVYVHCAKGQDRTGYCIASYRMVVEGWSADDAIAEMEEFHFNPVWIGNEGALRRLDVGKLRQRLSAER